MYIKCLYIKCIPNFDTLLYTFCTQNVYKMYTKCLYTKCISYLNKLLYTFCIHCFRVGIITQNTIHSSFMHFYRGHSASKQLEKGQGVYKENLTKKLTDV